MICIQLVIALLSILLAGNCWATPSISSISGTVTKDGTITLLGSGFGSKSPVAPLLWSNFENGVNGAALPTVATWTAYKGNGGTFVNTNSYSGSLAAYSSYNYSSPDGEVTSNYIFPSEHDEIYYSYMMKGVHVTGTPIGGEGQKAGRITGTGNLYNQAGVASLSYNAVTYSPADNTSVAVGPNWWDGSDGKGTNSPRWQRHELYHKISTAGVADGAMWCNVWDGQANPDSSTYWANANSHSITNAMTRNAGLTFKHNSIWLGINYTNSGIDSSHEIWVDDVYVDNTQARVELCSGSTWATRTHCEPQIPKTTWNDTTSIITVNTGTLVTGTTAYLYVVDSAGAVNANGYQVTVNSGSSDVTKPTTTTNEPSGRRTETRLVTMVATDDVQVTATYYCLTTEVSCTPATTYTVPFKVMQNLAAQTYCVSSTDGTNEEIPKCFNLKKQRRK